MTYQDDSNLNRRTSRPMTEDRSYTGWIIGGIVAVAVILGIFLMTGRNNDTTATNNRTTTSAPATTGTAVKPPAPAPVQPTNPAGNVPTTPAPAR